MDTKKRIVRRKKGEPFKKATLQAEVEAESKPVRPEPTRKSSPKAPKPKLDLSGLEALAKGADFDMAAIMDDVQPAATKHQIGDRVSGNIASITAEMLLVHIGTKMEATCDRAEWPSAKIGDTIEAYIVSIESDEIQISRRLAGLAGTAMLETAFEKGIPIEGTVRSKNTGGYEVFIGKTRAFCPMSQIHRLPGTDPDQWIGQTLSFKVIEFGDKNVVSRRALQEDEIEHAVAEFWQSASAGQIVQGTVTSVHEWGAYVDVNGVEGRLHRRDMSWDGETDPLGTYVRGQNITAQIRELQPENQRISLSVKSASDDPWERAGVEFVVGGEYAGKVVRVEAFGAFIQLAPGLTGLVHISNFRLASLSVPGKGDTLAVSIKAIDLEKRRLDLGLPGQDTANIPSLVKGVVAEVMRNGAVVQLEDGGTGWLPEAEAELPPGTMMAQRFRRGRAVTARVLDAQGRRLTLTLKEESDSDGSWSNAQPAEEGTFGTLGDLFTGLKKT